MTSQEQAFENYGNNIWLPSIRRIIIEHSNKELINKLLVYAQNVCGKDIEKEYIYESFNTFTHGYVYYDDHRENSPILGFVIWKEKYNKAQIRGGFSSFIYINLICVQNNDKHICRRIMYDIEVIAIERKINLIELHSLKNKVNLYKHFGYKMVREDTLEMSKIIITLPPAPPKLPTQSHSNETVHNCDPRSPL